MKNIRCVALLLCIILLTSCATYHVSTQNLLEQFANTGTEKKAIALPLTTSVSITPNISVALNIFFIKVVNGNDLITVKCLDNKEREITIEITNHTGIRITKFDCTSTTFYFNTLILKDSTITGGKTHFFNAPIKPIKFADISKIEIQK